MDGIELVRPSPAYADEIEAYRAEFPADRVRVTLDPDRIPGLDYLERFSRVADWLRFCEGMQGRITWYLTVRAGDGKIVGCCCLRHRLEYDDDDLAFASHIGYSVRPSERGRGYAEAQLRLVLPKAHERGIDPARIVCRDVNEASNRTIRACGGVLVDSLYGQASGLTVNRYDVPTGAAFHPKGVCAGGDHAAEL